MSKHRGGGQPEFSRLSRHIRGLAKGWYKKYVNRANRKRLRQSRDIETFKDKPPDPWALD